MIRIPVLVAFLAGVGATTVGVLALGGKLDQDDQYYLVKIPKANANAIADQITSSQKEGMRC